MDKRKTPFNTVEHSTEILQSDSLVPENDSLYSPKSASPTLRNLSFVLFEEIVEDSPFQTRKIIFDPKIHPKDQELLDSVRANGIVQPIVVKSVDEDIESSDPFAARMKKGDRKFALIAGHRRVAAGRAAGLKGTEAVIARVSDAQDLITWAENVGHRDLTSYEKALALKSIQEDRELSVKKTAEITGVSRTHARRLLTALDAPTPLKEPWMEGSLSPHVLIDLKDHWDRLDNIKDRQSLSIIKSLSRNDAGSLKASLNAGMDLKTALLSIGSPGVPSTKNKSSSKTRASRQDPSPSPFDKEALASSINAVFPKVKKEQGEALFDLAVASGTKDLDTIWAAALFVAKRGKLDNSIELASTAMEKPALKRLVAKQIKHMKQASSLLDSLDSKDKALKAYVKKVFS